MKRERKKTCVEKEEKKSRQTSVAKEKEIKMERRNT